MDIGKKIMAFHVDGGACRNNLLMQIQANYIGTEVRRPAQVETTVSGAALGAQIQLNNIQPESLAAKQNFDAKFSSQASTFSVSRRSKWHSLLEKIYL